MRGKKVEDKFLMQIDFIFQKEKRIAGGTNLKCSKESFDLLNRISNNIIIKTKNGDFVFEVKKVDVFLSIAGFMNIGITLYDRKEFCYLNIEDKVYLMSV